jgi:transposase
MRRAAVEATQLIQAALGSKYIRVTSVRTTWLGFVAAVEPATPVPICSGCFRAVEKVHDRKRDRNWRALDVCGVKLILEYDLKRVNCPECGVTVELVPWADPESQFTYAFEEQTAYLAQKCDRTSVSTTMRIAWPTVGTIIERVVKRERRKDPLEGLTHIGIDELSYKKHHHYITVVVNLLTGAVVWAHTGKNADTVKQFFKDLGPERSGEIELVTIDMSPAYIEAVQGCAPKAKLVFDRFHVQRLVHDALDEVRRAEVAAWGVSSPQGQGLKRTRWALQKNPWNLTPMERGKVSFIQRANKSLYRAYLLKESLAGILDGRQVNVARTKLGEWITWALRSRLQPFRTAAQTIHKHLEGILAYVQTRFSNGPTEGLNGKIRTITRRSFGFHRAESLIAFIFLCCSGVNFAPVHTLPLPFSI